MRSASLSPARSGWRTYSLSLKALTLYAAAHVILCCLQVLYLPMAGRWGHFWLGLDAVLALAAGGCLCAARLRRRDARGAGAPLRSLVREPGAALLFVWLLWTAAALILAVREGRTYLSSNARYFYYQCGEMLILFPLGLQLGRRRSFGLLRLLYDVCLALFAGMLGYMLLRFFLGSPVFTFMGRQVSFLTTRPRFGQNPNLTGAYACLFLTGGLVRFPALRPGWRRWLLGAALGVALCALAMTESRGAMIGLSLAVGVGAGAALYRRFSGGARAAAAALGAAVLAAALCMGTVYALRLGMLSLQRAVLARAGADAAEGASALSGRGVRALVGPGGIALGSRRRIWAAVLRHAFSDRHILTHGCSLAATSFWMEEVLGRAYRTHNQFMEVLAAQGLPALILFLAWLVPVAGRSLSLGLRGGRDGTWRLPLVLLALLANNMAEMMLVGRMHLTACFFFLTAGYVCSLAPVKVPVHFDSKEADP